MKRVNGVADLGMIIVQTSIYFVAYFDESAHSSGIYNEILT